MAIRDSLTLPLILSASKYCNDESDIQFPALCSLSAFGIDRLSVKELQYLKYLCNVRKRSLFDPNHGNLAVENKFCFVVTTRCQIWGSIELHCVSKHLTHHKMH